MDGVIKKLMAPFLLIYGCCCGSSGAIKTILRGMFIQIIISGIKKNREFPLLSGNKFSFTSTIVKSAAARHNGMANIYQKLNNGSSTKNQQPTKKFKRSMQNAIEEVFNNVYFSIHFRGATVSYSLSHFFSFRSTFLYAQNNCCVEMKNNSFFLPSFSLLWKSKHALRKGIVIFHSRFLLCFMVVPHTNSVILAPVLVGMSDLIP